jgi:hypothetical protein
MRTCRTGSIGGQGKEVTIVFTFGHHRVGVLITRAPVLILLCDMRPADSYLSRR